MKVRIRFTKLGKVRFTSHRDVARILERAARRAELPLAYTQGFSPRPRLSFGLALPTGCESLGEYADISLDVHVDADDVARRLTSQLPPGMEVTAAVVLEGKGRSLQEVVERCTWHIELPDVATDAVESAALRVLAQDEIIIRRHRKGREIDDDIRPGILHLEVRPLPPAGSVLIADLAPRGVRPGDLMEALDAAWEPIVMRRENQLIATADGWREPLASGAAATSSARERAS